MQLIYLGFRKGITWKVGEGREAGSTPSVLASNVAADAVVVAHQCAGITTRIEGGDASSVREASGVVGEDHLTTAVLPLVPLVGCNVLTPLGILT